LGGTITVQAGPVGAVENTTFLAQNCSIGSCTIPTNLTIQWAAPSPVGVMAKADVANSCVTGTLTLDGVHTSYQGTAEAFPLTINRINSAPAYVMSGQVPYMQTVQIPLTTLQSFVTPSQSFNVGPVLPANARLLGAEIVVNIAFTGPGLVSATGTVQGSTDAAGTLVTGASLTTVQKVGNNGSNPYNSRGGQQVTVVVTLVGLNLNQLTSGNINVNLFFQVLTP
jgi:hypothetical protein